MGHVVALSLDEFYHDFDYPGLPLSPVGITDWDDVRSWDLELALATLARLLNDGEADVPEYSISRSQRTGMRRLTCGDAQIILAEGIFAPQTYVALRKAGIPARAIWLDRPRAANCARRLVRDLRERRKPPMVLVKRGAALFRAEPTQRAQAMASGFEPVSMRTALRLVRDTKG